MTRIVKAPTLSDRLRKLRANLAYQETMLTVDRRSVIKGRRIVKKLRADLKRLEASQVKKRLRKGRA